MTSLCFRDVTCQRKRRARTILKQSTCKKEREVKPCRNGIHLKTCAGGVLRLEQPHYAFPVEAASTQQHSLGARVLPAHHRQPVVSVTACDFLQTAVLH